MTHIGHIAMVGLPSHGHVNPGLPVIRELVDRGYRVSYSINEEFAPLVEAAGATPVCYKSTLFSESDPDTSWPEDPVEMMASLLDEAIAVLPQLAAAYAEDRPDLILHDIVGYAGRILAAQWGIPVVTLSPTFVPWEGFEKRMGPLIRAMRRQPAGTAYFIRFAQWLAEQGIDLTIDEFLWRPQLGVVLLPRAVQPHAERVAPCYTFVGRCLNDHAHQDGWEPPNTPHPVLLISLGSIFTRAPLFYRQCIEAFGELDWHVVMVIGHQVDPAELGPVPANFEVHPWVPQFSILSRASAFVTHAGPGGICEGLYHGVPMVAVPQAFDQHSYAAQLVGLGVGRHLRRDRATADVLREAVLSIASNPDVAARLATIKEEMRRPGGAAAAADLIERQLPATGRSAS